MGLSRKSIKQKITVDGSLNILIHVNTNNASAFKRKTVLLFSLHCLPSPYGTCFREKANSSGILFLTSLVSTYTPPFQ